jgi:hypothetical protein
MKSDSVGLYKLMHKKYGMESREVVSGENEFRLPVNVNVRKYDLKIFANETLNVSVYEACFPLLVVDDTTNNDPKSGRIIESLVNCRTMI